MNNTSNMGDLLEKSPKSCQCLDLARRTAVERLCRYRKTLFRLAGAIHNRGRIAFRLILIDRGWAIAERAIAHAGRRFFTKQDSQPSLIRLIRGERQLPTIVQLD